MRVLDNGLGPIMKYHQAKLHSILMIFIEKEEHHIGKRVTVQQINS